MRVSKAIACLFIPLAGLVAALIVASGAIATAPGAAAQSLTAPAGQKRITAPGGTRGRAARRGSRFRLHHRR